MTRADFLYLCGFPFGRPSRNNVVGQWLMDWQPRLHNGSDFQEELEDDDELQVLQQALRS